MITLCSLHIQPAIPFPSLSATHLHIISNISLSLSHNHQSIRAPLRRLRQLLVIDHLILERHQNMLQRVLVLPVPQDAQPRRINLNNTSIRTAPLPWFTQGRFTFVVNLSLGGRSGYSGPHSNFRLMIRLSKLV
jgi:hypothetical protein